MCDKCNGGETFGPLYPAENDWVGGTTWYRFGCVLPSQEDVTAAADRLYHATRMTPSTGTLIGEIDRIGMRKGFY